MQYHWGWGRCLRTDCLLESLWESDWAEWHDSEMEGEEQTSLFFSAPHHLLNTRARADSICFLPYSFSFHFVRSILDILMKNVVWMDWFETNKQPTSHTLVLYFFLSLFNTILNKMITSPKNRGEALVCSNTFVLCLFVFTLALNTG